MKEAGQRQVSLVSHLVQRMTLTKDHVRHPNWFLPEEDGHDFYVVAEPRAISVIRFPYGDLHIKFSWNVPLPPYPR